MKSTSETRWSVMARVVFTITIVFNILCGVTHSSNRLFSFGRRTVTYMLYANHQDIRKVS